jgi:amidase
MVSKANDAGHEVLNLSALEQARLIGQRAISSESLTRLYLDRIQAFNPDLNAFVHLHRKRALKKARRLDEVVKRNQGNDLPVFHGVPTGIKDLVPVAGTPSRLGSRAYRYFIAPFDGSVVKHLNAGGFVSLGKLATSEFGVLPTTEPDIHPPTRNPWDLTCTPGGSSGGSGSAVAAGLIPIAQGSDGGGSVRIPAALCHLYGFKPSLSLLGNLHGRYNQLGISVMGPLARYVSDAAAMLDVMAGHPMASADQDTCLNACNKTLKPLKICMILDSVIGEAKPEILAGIRQLAQTLESMGHQIVEKEPARGDLEEFLPVWRYAVGGVPAISERVLRPVSRWLRADAKHVSFEEADNARRRLAQQVHDIMDDADVCLSPTVGIGAPKIGQFETPEDPRAWFYNSAYLGAYTAPFNLTHGPAASLPIGLTEAGLPYGAQIAGRPGADHLILSLSKQLEDALPWHDRWAPGYQP